MAKAEEVATKKKRRASGPKPVYIVYTTDENGKFSILCITRRADKALSTLDEHDDAQYTKKDLD